MKETAEYINTAIRKGQGALKLLQLQVGTLMKNVFFNLVQCSHWDTNFRPAAAGLDTAAWKFIGDFGGPQPHTGLSRQNFPDERNRSISRTTWVFALRWRSTTHYVEQRRIRIDVRTSG